MWNFWWPWSKKDKDKGNGEDDYPEEYCKGKCTAKGKRAKQLHGHDHKSREVLDDIDMQINRLQKISAKIRGIDLKKQIREGD